MKSPLTGGAVPLSSLVDIDSNGVGPLLVSHQGQFPAVTITFNLVPRRRARRRRSTPSTTASREIGMPSAIIPTFQGNAQAFQTSLRSEPALIGAALIVVYIILGILYESFIHPLTILSTLPSAGVGALLALSLGHMDLSVIGIIGIILLDRHRQEERHHAGGFRHRRRARPRTCRRSTRSAKPACCASARS